MMLLAHGIGARGDLPLSVGTLAVVAGVAVFVSFAALLTGWKEPRFAAIAEGRTVFAVNPGAVISVTSITRTLGALAVGVSLWSALFVEDSTVENIAPRMVYVLFWIVIPLSSVVFGDLWRLFSPFEAIASLTKKFRHARPTSKQSGSLYGAAFFLLLFLWLELSFHRPAGRTPLAIMLIVWVGWCSQGAVRGGTTWLGNNDPLAVLTRLMSSVSCFTVRANQLIVRRPIVGLADVPTQRGLAAVVLVVLGGTSFDGLSRTDWWTSLISGKLEWARTFVNTLGLLFVTALIISLFLGAVRMMQRKDENEDPMFEDGFAVSLVPVLVGYGIAHYFSMAIFEGQFLLIQASDPFGLGWDLFGTRTNYVNYRIVSSTTIAAVQASGIIAGHVAGVVVGHDRALESLKKRESLAAQLPLVALLVALTIIALLLLVEA
ncbi:MAG: hypothetical protein P8R36_04590 [Actinomycetota bacterium]|nr:hypothetical protein [Actinomycetota bacterium]MDG1489545.1 hypothetical protein [Actinomycetota bacterium]MDG2121626.1 hypothetical protein [Actinomycetota bacterium]